MKNYCKEILDTYTLTDTTVNENAAIPFEQNYLSLGNSIYHAPGTSTIQISCPGYYLINFNAEGSTAGGTGNFSVQLFNNGISIPGATSNSSNTSTTDIETIGFSKIIQVKPSCCSINNTANLTLVNTGASSIYTTANLNISKI